MKSLKNVLATLAFVFASVAAFATLGNSNSNGDIAQITAYKTVTTPCDTQVICGATFTGISCDNYRTNPDECSGTLPPNLWEQ